MVNTFPKGICTKVNVIARLEYELTYYDPTVQRFNHYSMRTPPPRMVHDDRDVSIKEPVRDCN